ncbi:phage holin family protein [Flavobacterium sp.]|uniref:phage holin family protein n=1 Tax=Flavobacterium sp. TaxID=239 RepID=UPI002D193B5F|nr:phage holin family protein [Flavobacterium sp.]HSD07901.1 phage holin family protein [Flavobacterium sp.]
MKEIMSIALPKFTLLTVLGKKPILLIPVVPIATATAVVVDFETMFQILGLFFIADLGTGLWASYNRWKKSDRKDNWFFGRGKDKEGFSSDKAKQMGIKALIYLVVPLAFIKLQNVLYLKNWKYERISDAEFQLGTLSIILFCLIEGFSIFHENLPECGFNLWERIRKMIGFYKEVKNEINI